MASVWRLRRRLPSGESAPRLREMLTVPALIARSPALATVVLSVAIGVQAIAIVLSLASELSAGASARVPASPPLRDKHLAELAGITQAHLFGIAPQKAALATVVSHSPLVLTGTLATGDPHDGFAIVGTSADSARAVYVGSEAAPGTILIAVYPHWVVLQRGDERLKLHFPHDHLMAGATYVNALNAQSAATPDDYSGGEGVATHEQPARPPVTDDAAVLSSFALVATTTGDGQQGMRIAGTAFNRKTLAALGLRSGDVIVQVNGAPIGSANGDLSRALQSGSATLTFIDRGGDESSVTIDSSSLASAAQSYRQADPDL